MVIEITIIFFKNNVRKIVILFKGLSLFFILISFILGFSSGFNSLGFYQHMNQNVVDGIVAINEYEYNSIFNNEVFTLYWTIDGDEIYFAMVGKTVGWVALGINPKSMMLEADMILGYVANNGTAVVTDAYSIGLTGPHPADTELGGTNDISEYNGTESNGITTIEFKRLMITTDTYDQALPKSGDVKIIWALGDEDSIEAKHLSQRGSAQWNVEGTSIFNADFVQPFILGTFLIGSLLAMLIFVDIKDRKTREINQGGKD